MKNDLLKELRRVRDQIGAECGYDLKRLATLVRHEESKVGKRLVISKPAARVKRAAVAA